MMQLLKPILLTLLMSSISLSGCATPKNQLSPEMQQKVQKLLEKTKKNMVFVQGGSYMMGDWGPTTREDGLPYDGRMDSKPAHKVTLDSFSIAAYKTSYEDMDIYSEATNTTKVNSTETVSSLDRYPETAAGVAWQEGRNYCQWLGKQLNVNMDLPTEAQWEYAARNRGQNVLYATNNGEIEIGKNVWSDEQRTQYQRKALKTYNDVPILGKFPPNPLGLYDLLTDNYEWMLDWYNPNYYSESPEHNPQGPATGEQKVLRANPPSEIHNLTLNGSTLTVKKFHAYPIENPNIEDLEERRKMHNQNFEHSVRCVVNTTQPLQ